MALQNHPDKNGNSYVSTEKFKQIKESYELLKREIQDESIDFEDKEKEKDIYSYNDLLSIFIKELLKGKFDKSISIIINDIVSGYKKISIALFENMDKEHSLTIYQFLSKYKSILHIDAELLEKVKEIILEKYTDIQLFSLNPSLKDIIENNIYKLEVDNVIYFVPLWHDEVYFDSDIIVKCNPELPENVFIDDDNNIIIKTNILFTFSLIMDNFININIEDNLFRIPVSELKMKEKQYVILKNRGISNIDENDIYNIGEKSNVIIEITLIQK